MMVSFKGGPLDGFRADFEDEAFRREAERRAVVYTHTQDDDTAQLHHYTLTTETRAELFYQYIGACDSESETSKI